MFIAEHLNNFNASHINVFLLYLYFLGRVNQTYTQ